MKDKTKVIILSVGLTNDGESGIRVDLPVKMLEAVADKILLEQEKCELSIEGGAVARLISAYAELLGYEDGFFVDAREMRGL